MLRGTAKDVGGGAGFEDLAPGVRGVGPERWHTCIICSAFVCHKAKGGVVIKMRRHLLRFRGRGPVAAHGDVQLLGEHALSKLAFTAFSQSSWPAFPALSISATSLSVMFVQGV